MLLRYLGQMLAVFIRSFTSCPLWHLPNSQLYGRGQTSKRIIVPEIAGPQVTAAVAVAVAAAAVAAVVAQVGRMASSSAGLGRQMQ